MSLTEQILVSYERLLGLNPKIVQVLPIFFGHFYLNYNKYY